jgi:hypothetical protein
VIGLREASGFEGLIVLGVIYFIVSQVQKAGKRGGRPAIQPPDRQPPSASGSAREEQRLSLDTILKEIERVKRQKQLEQPEPARPPLLSSRPAAKPMVASRAGPPQRPEVIQDERGPLGRVAKTRLESAGDVEVRISADEQAEGVVQQRLREVAARNRPLAEADHQAFDQQVRAGEGPPGATRRYTADQLRQALVWREILGPPKALEE